MIRIATKRTIISTISICLSLLFVVALVFAGLTNNRMRDGVNWAYYTFSLLVVVMSVAYVCLIVHSFSYSDTNFCSVLCYISLILYCIVDVGVRNLFPLVPRVDSLDMFIHIRDFLTFMIMAFMLFDQYSGIFHGKDGYRTSIFVALVIAFVLVLLLPSENALNIHYFFLILALFLGTVFHSIVYNLTATNLKFKSRLWNAFCSLLSEAGIFMFVISLNTMVSAFGTLLMLLSFIVFCLDTLKKAQEE